MARILLADDDAASREFMQRALSGAGHTVEVHSDGGEALDAILSGEPTALLVADLQMPVLDGLALAGKALAARPNIKVILISGFAEGIGRARQLGDPRVATLLKPFTLEQFRAAVKAAL
jgi:two-component system cell cycle sensor histidine kinase/response regulator CckA